MDYPSPFSCTSDMRRSDRTMVRVKQGIADLISVYKSEGADLLEIGVNHGTQTVGYHARFNNPGRLEGYDWKDFRHDAVKDKVIFSEVNIEKERFPAKDSSFDVVVCNQVLEHLKNIYTPLSEIWRVLKPDGLLVFSVPNLSCWHNCLLLAVGRQPTTLNIAGSHVRGYAIWSATKFLTKNNLLKLRELRGYGFPPFFESRVYGPLRTYCHTPIWALTKNNKDATTWEQERQSSFTTTSFFDD